MDILIIVFALLLSITGIAGCVLPGLPGVPLNFFALLLLQWSFKPFSATFLWWMAGITLFITVLDYLIPVWGAKVAGASKYGVWGSMIGMIVGMFFTPVGMIMGALLGAIIGETLNGKEMGEALKAGFGTLLGLLFGTVIKLLASVVMFFYFITSAGEYLYIMYM